MPNITYGFINPAGAGCLGVGVGAQFTSPPMPNPITLGWAQLMNAQLRLGVYPVGWVADEISWRIYSLCVACAQVGVGAVPGVPAGVPPIGMPPGVPVGGGVANLPPSPIATGVDSTEKGQLGYHLGTAIGGALGEYLTGIGGGSLWYPFHLTRAEANGGQFVHGAQRPDIVTFDVHPGTLHVNSFVVWENKGHAASAVGGALLNAALAQAQSIVNMTHWPGNPHIGAGVPGGAAIPGGFPPTAYLASQVDRVYGNYRVQVIDPPGIEKQPFLLQPQRGDDFFRGYYAPFVEALHSAKATRLQQYGSRKFMTAGFVKNVRIGLDNEIFLALKRKGRPGELSASIANALGDGYSYKSDEYLHINQTGISVKLPSGWQPTSSKKRR